MNPYASPAYVGSESPAAEAARAKPRFWRAIGRWALICSVSAAPSFFWGCGLHHQPEQIAAMLSGIAVFIVAYAVLECSPLYQRLSRLPYMRRTIMIGYGTRLAVSIIFPVGMTVDMFTGVLAVALVEQAMFVGAGVEDISFLAVFLTTIIQGLLLNLILSAYMLVILAVQWSFGSMAQPGRESA